MKTPRFLQALAVMAAMLVPTAASADENLVQSLLMGGRAIDPYATTLQIAPPEGATVMITRDGKAVNFLSRQGFVSLQPNATYGITAVRGKTMIFSQQLVARRGKHELTWNDGVATLSFAPFFVYPVAPVADMHMHMHGASGYPGRGHHHNGDGAEDDAPPQGDVLSDSRFERVERHMAMLPSDQLRLNVLKPWTMRAVFSKAQARDLKATFTTHEARRMASALLRRRVK